MARERVILLFAVVALLGPFSALARVGERHTVERSLQVGKLDRTYRLHVPPSYRKDKPVAFMVALHGGGGNAHQAERFMKFSFLSDREGFIVAYPDAIEKNWNDGRGDCQMRAQREDIDDVGFIRALVTEISKEYSVDPKRVYATGPSNGGIMSNRLGAEASDLFAAIAPVIGGMAPKIADAFKPAHPISVLILQGIEDPLVPYEGGEIRVFGGRGRGSIVPTADTVKKWVAHNGCGQAKEEELDDKDPKDGTRVTRAVYPNGKKKTEVVVYSIEGGGHTWPGGTQYLPERAIGRVCRDIDATRIIWEFFKDHPRP